MFSVSKIPFLMFFFLRVFDYPNSIFLSIWTWNSLSQWKRNITKARFKRPTISLVCRTPPSLSCAVPNSIRFEFGAAKVRPYQIKIINWIHERYGVWIRSSRVRVVLHGKSCRDSNLPAVPNCFRRKSTYLPKPFTTDSTAAQKKARIK